MTLRERLLGDLDRWADRGGTVPGDELRDFLVERRREVAPMLRSDALAEALAAWWVRWLRRKSQFAELDARTVADGYRRALAEVADVLARAGATEKVAEILASHHRRVMGFIASLDPPDTVSAEYSAALQLQVLGLSAETLAEPILDVGCGANASLVRALRDAGHDATGIDRDAPADVGVVADWLGFVFGEDRWGTVVSHLAFSLHFLHHHLAGRPLAFTYAKQYMAILRSLRAGGTFAYVPALPFIEDLLPTETYRIERTPVAGTDQTSTRVVRLDIPWGLHSSRETP
jgi:hypothetical protein